MQQINIKAFVTWVKEIGILGVRTSPLYLRVEVENKTSSNFMIDKVCISIKKDWLFFTTLKEDILEENVKFGVSKNKPFAFRLDIRNILNYYDDKTKFTVKMNIKNKVYESEILTVSKLQNIKSGLRN